MKMTERIFDAATGLQKDIERDFTDEEIAAFEKYQAEINERLAKEAEISAKRAALLEKLGITEDEAKLLLS